MSGPPAAPFAIANSAAGGPLAFPGGAPGAQSWRG
jgi:hypothetical protein